MGEISCQDLIVDMERLRCFDRRENYVHVVKWLLEIMFQTTDVQLYIVTFRSPDAWRRYVWRGSDPCRQAREC
jgi:hypothetical protein